MIFGAHVSIASGIEYAPEKAEAIGADAVQIFASPPANFAFSSPTQFQIELFRYRVRRAKINSIFLHGVYLINLASDSPQILDLSIKSLTSYQALAGKLGAIGTIFHLGSHKGRGFKSVFPTIVKALKQVLSNQEKDLFLIIENSAQAAGRIGANFFELGSIIKKAKDPRLKVCLDTCHLFVSGYPIHQKDGLDETLRKFGKEVGFEKLVLIHANDSKTPFLSAIDRHEDIGKGYIGLQGFKNIVNHKRLRYLPFIIETPGFEEKGPDRKNLEILRSLVRV